MKLKDSQKLFNVLADGTRLRILNLLIDGELCVCDLILILKVPQSKISRHLSYLKKSGFVESRKDGLWMHYFLPKSPPKLCVVLLKVVRGCRENLDEFKKDIKALQVNKNSLVGRSQCC